MKAAKQPALPAWATPHGYALRALGPNGPSYFMNVQDQSAQLVQDARSTPSITGSAGVEYKPRIYLM